MKALSLEIKPLTGFGDLEFGCSPEALIAYLGEPEEKEEMEDEEMGDSLIYHYDEKGISAFFEIFDEAVLTTFESDNPEVTLFGKKVFALNEKEIIKLMKQNGFTDTESEVLDDEDYQNEKRVSFDEALMDFYFEGDILTAISWGAYFDMDEDDEDDE